MTIEERLARLEESVALIAARIDKLDSAPKRAADPIPPYAAGQQAVEIRARSAPRVAISSDNPLASKSTEWWLARGGAVLTLFALILLYQYAVEHNWITPLVRVFAGTFVGVALFVWGHRTPRRADGADVGMREVLLGAALAAWYITAYAAAIFYSLITLSTARVLFLGLSVLGAWLSLRETRSILANLALAVGFATPLLLPSDNPSVPAFSIYLATLTAIGLIIYLMRGWQLVLWLTFFAFWASISPAADIACCADTNATIRIAGSLMAARISLSALIVLGALAFMRVPTLRRGLLATGSELYTEPRRSENAATFQGETAQTMSRLTARPAEDDSAILWAFVLLSPLIALTDLSRTLNHAPLWQWGVIALIAAFVAWRAIASTRELDTELRHVLAAAVVLWSLAGLGVTAWDAAPWPLRRESLTLLALSVHSLVTLELTHASRYAVPRRIGLATAFGVLFTVLFSELIAASAGVPFDGQWLIAELAAVALAVWVWWNQRQFKVDGFARVIGVGAYIAILAIDARVLGTVWQPLVTASYAIAGASLLVLGRKPEGTQTMRRLGSFTLILVVARLLLVDLARVETIWRVLLFLGCGALFLVTSYRLQASGREQSA